MPNNNDDDDDDNNNENKVAADGPEWRTIIKSESLVHACSLAIWNSCAEYQKLNAVWLDLYFPYQQHQ